MRQRAAAPFVVPFVLGMIAGAALCALVVSMMRGGFSGSPQHVDVLRREIAQDHWQTHGFVQMVPPIRLPTTRDADGDIKVWLKIPDTGVISARVSDTGRKIDFPAGTVADRVETVGDVVADVRGTTLLEDGERFHVFVPGAASAQSPLTGWDWPRGDPASEARATDELIAFLASAPLLDIPRDRARARAQRAVDYRRNNECARCHFPDKPETHDSDDLVHRGTDDDGFYVPLSVLSDEGVLERHRPRDGNLDDRFTTLRCASGPVRVVERDGNRRPRCDDGSAVLGRFDTAAALAVGDPHAKAVCASRRALHAHMDANARALFADAFRVCGM